MHTHSAGLTHIGHRNNNEDAHYTNCAVGLHVVADGMGGYEGGEVASRIAVETLSAFVERNAHDADATWPFGLDSSLSHEENLIATGVRIAGTHVRAHREGALREMGSTVAVLFVQRGRVVVAHVGDSRVYRLRHGALEQLTRDHSLWEELRRAGAQVPPKHEFSGANIITRALGMQTPIHVEVACHAPMPGDVFLLCTDGLLESVSDAEIAVELSRPNPREAAQALVARAESQGSRDNTTVVVVRIVA